MRVKMSLKCGEAYKALNGPMYKDASVVDSSIGIDSFVLI